MENSIKKNKEEQTSVCSCLCGPSQLASLLIVADCCLLLFLSLFVVVVVVLFLI